MDALHIILPIGIGALIGYCTNYIAIKMLFHPRKEVRIGGWKVPFTPGVIPKNQERIAAATGAAVGNSLLTSEDITSALKSEELLDTLADAVVGGITNMDASIGECLEKVSGESQTMVMDKASVMITEKIKSGISKVDFTELIVNVAAPALMEKTRGTMLAMFINESTIASFAEPVGAAIEGYMNENGGEVIFPMVRGELAEMQDKQVGELIQESGINFDGVKQMVKDIFLRIIEENVDKILTHFDVVKLVEDKINAMDVKELEELVMSVMKHELQAVINLGAVIGALIGTLNIFI